MQLTSLSLALTRAGFLSAFSPASLFALGEQGAWYDPSDIKLDWRYNLLTRTEEFDNAAWVKSNATVTANATTAPDGSLTADKLVANTNNASHYAYELASVASGVVYTFAVFVQKAEYSRISIGRGTAAGGLPTGGAGWYVDLNTGAVVGTPGWSIEVTPAANGAYRIAGSFTATATSAGDGPAIYIQDSTGATFVGDGTSGIYIWGASLTTAANADKPYQKITDGVSDYFTYQPQPVLFQDAAGTTPVTAVEQPVGLMLDKSKGLVWSSNLVTGITATNSTYSNGEVVDAISTLPHGLSIFHTSSEPFTTVSIRAKAGTKSWVWMYFGGYASGSGWFDLSTGTTGTAEAGVTTSITEDSGGYYICTLKKKNIAATASVSIFAQTANGSTASYLGTGEVALYIDNISVRELPGAHAFQTTSTSRPVLSARYNLLTKTEQFDDGVWFKSNSSVVNNSTIAPYGAFTADTLTANAGSSIQPWVIATNISFTAGLEYKYSCFVKKNTHNFFQIATSSSGSFANFDIANGVAGTFGGGTSEITALDNGWYRVTHTFMASSTTTSGFVLLFISASNSAIRLAPWSPVGNESVYIWGASLVPANQSDLPYQRVNTATDYDAGPAFPRYLRADGIDDGMVTGTITPGTDKAQVFAGVRKLSDAASGILMELSFEAAANPGSFGMVAPSASGANSYRFQSRGSLWGGLGAGSGVFAAAPDTSVLSGIGSISEDVSTLRRNGVLVETYLADQGTGNYLAYPIYLFRRGGTTLPFNGHFYGGIIRFGDNLPIETIQQTEAWMAAKTGVTL